VSRDLFHQPVDTMTSGQLVRRRRLTDAVIEMVSETGPESLQMREVSERSGVALGTAYRYFTSKDHLMAAAWAEWHHSLTARVMVDLDRRGGTAGTGEDVLTQVLGFVGREVRAFQRNPNFARLAVYLEACTDPFVSEVLARIGEENSEVMRALMAELPEDVARPAGVAIGATLGSGLTQWVTGRATVTDVMRNIEEVARLVLGDRTGRRPPI
jgi:AcrR family transcriptional regulator